ncbi:hypothetical protein ACFFLM_05700 [Deinococcus oregonensis]|uniref:Uncharacterized protein n=1 Tax=Deinococcus oregonensis TaxID=1805970 RepID=A0ABV6AZ65_9DEIO
MLHLTSSRDTMMNLAEQRINPEQTAEVSINPRFTFRPAFQCHLLALPFQRSGAALP